MLVFAALCAALMVAFRHLPSSFLPEEDQGYFMTSIQLPADATVERTLEVVKAYEQHAASRPSIRSNITVVGFGFSGSGPNAAMAFTMLKDWGERNGATAQGEVALAQAALSGTIEGTVITLLPPGVAELAPQLHAETPVRLVLYPGEGHGNRRAAARYDFNLRMMEWFDTYLKTGNRTAPIPGPRPALPEEALGK